MPNSECPHDCDMHGVCNVWDIVWNSRSTAGLLQATRLDDDDTMFITAKTRLSVFSKLRTGRKEMTRVAKEWMLCYAGLPPPKAVKGTMYDERDTGTQNHQLDTNLNSAACPADDEQNFQNCSITSQHCRCDLFSRVLGPFGPHASARPSSDDLVTHRSRSLGKFLVSRSSLEPRRLGGIL